MQPNQIVPDGGFDTLRLVAALGPLFTAFATLFVGIAVAVIAYRQWKTAREKLIFDLFQRRFDVYQRAYDTAYSISVTGIINKESVDALLNARNEAIFLFDDDVFGLIGETYSASLQWYGAELEQSPNRHEKAREGMLSAGMLVHSLPIACAAYMKMTQKM